MANTYTLISKVTVGSGGAASMAFTSIPATYTDLLLSISQRNTAGGNVVDVLNATFNGTSPGTGDVLEGTGAGVSSFGSTRIGISQGPATTSNTFNNAELYITNYTSSNNKIFSADSIVENNATGGYQNLVSGFWSNSAAITSITLSANTFAEHSTAYLYGIKNS